jgi:hypothetical protein
VVLGARPTAGACQIGTYKLTACGHAANTPFAQGFNLHPDGAGFAAIPPYRGLPETLARTPKCDSERSSLRHLPPWLLPSPEPAIQQNLSWVFVYNVVGIPLASGGNGLR